MAKRPEIERFTRVILASTVLVSALSSSDLRPSGVPIKNVPVSAFGPQPFPQPDPLPTRASIKEKTWLDLVPKPDLLRLTTEGATHTKEIIEAAGGFMKLEVPKKGDKNKRTALEVAMFRKLQTQKASAADILLATQAAGTLERGWGMEMLWKQRQEGKLLEYGIMPLDNKEIEWAIANKIDPRTLAKSIDTRQAACDLLEAGRDLFFEAVPDLDRTGIKCEETLPNPGAMAQLMMTETGSWNFTDGILPINRSWGHVFIGSGSAGGKLNLEPDYFPKGQEHLMKIAVILQEQTGLPYRNHMWTIPGSDAGAIGTQFMPINALLFMNWYNEANRRLGYKYPPANPFDPFTGTIMSYLFLASEFYGRHGDITDKLEIVRPGYKALGTDEQQKQAYMKWNPHKDQVNSALAKGRAYEKKVLNRVGIR